MKPMFQKLKRQIIVIHKLKILMRNKIKMHKKVNKRINKQQIKIKIQIKMNKIIRHKIILFNLMKIKIQMKFLTKILVNNMIRHSININKMIQNNETKIFNQT